MKAINVFFVLLLIFFTWLQNPDISKDQNNDKTYAFINGQWFDGETFREGTLYSIGGVFTQEPPASVDSTINLQGGYVIPPFGEAHNHNISSEWTLNAMTPRYLKDGIFYVKITTSIAERIEPILEDVKQPETLDVLFGSAGLTAPGGHPEPLYRRLASTGAIPGLDPDNLDGTAYFTIDSEEELALKWASILSGKPDFIKMMLLFAAEEGRPGFGAGLHPKIYKQAVLKSHESGLRVTTHVESAADFALAVDAGTDEIAHLPGYYFRSAFGTDAYMIDEATANKAAQKGIVVVTTCIYSSVHQDSLDHGIARDIQSHNLQVLYDAGVPLAIGTDITESTSLDEAKYLHSLDLFDNRTLLRLWSEVTPKSIFPDREIGHLLPGYEASFLVLDCNPIEDFNCVEKIQLRVKQGHLIEIPNS